MKKYFIYSIILASTLFVNQFSLLIASAQYPTDPGGYPTGETIQPPPPPTVGETEPIPPPEPVPAPQPLLKCWGCVPEKSNCPLGGESVCAKEKDCADCSCKFVPKGYQTSNTRKHCATIFEDEDTPIGCHCIYCNY